MVIVMRVLLLLSKKPENYFQIPMFTCGNAVPHKSGTLVVKVNSSAAERAQQARCQKAAEMEE